jgi:hypothetical protein
MQQTMPSINTPHAMEYFQDKRHAMGNAQRKYDIMQWTMCYVNKEELTINEH